MNEILWKLYQVIFIPYSAQLNQWLPCVLLRWNGNPILPHGLIYEGVSETPLKVSVVHTAQWNISEGSFEEKGSIS